RPSGERSHRGGDVVTDRPREAGPFAGGTDRADGAYPAMQSPLDQAGQAVVVDRAPVRGQWCGQGDVDAAQAGRTHHHSAYLPSSCVQSGSGNDHTPAAARTTSSSTSTPRPAPSVRRKWPSMVVNGPESRT